MNHQSTRTRHRLGSWAAGLAAGATFGVLMTADAQIIVDPELPASMLEGSGMNLVDALREREQALEAQAAEIAEREHALLEQRALLVDDLEALRASRAEAPQPADTPDEADGTGGAPDTEPEADTADTVAAIEAEARAMQLDTLSRRVQAMSPAAAASMLTAMDPTLATEVLEAISARNSGKIMDQLSPDVAARLGSMMVRDTTGGTR